MNQPLSDNEGPEYGHTFHFVVTTRMAYGIEGVPGKQDADWWSEPWTLEVRAWDLPEACRKAAETPLVRWGMSVEVEDSVCAAQEDSRPTSRSAEA